MLATPATRAVAQRCVAVCVDGSSRVAPYIEARHVNYPVAIASEDIVRQYGVGIVAKGDYEAEIQSLIAK